MGGHCQHWRPDDDAFEDDDNDEEKEGLETELHYGTGPDLEYDIFNSSWRYVSWTPV